MKIAITGASGFIGTNLLQYYIDKGYDVINYDYNKPRNNLHNQFWCKINILDNTRLEKSILEYCPDYLIHLAARTDLNGATIEEYSMNYVGVENVINALKKSTTIKRAIFASSMLVCKLGYIPKNMDDYYPTTLYGQSKVMAEKIIKNANNLNFDIVIIRPTSIWGPWFGSPYLQFFQAIRNKVFFKFGKKLATKTFGYVGNSVIQIDSLLLNNKQFDMSKVYYIGDYPPLCISDWADSISNIMGVSPPHTIPLSLVRILSKIGDILTKCGLNYPITSFRLNNMTKDNIIDLNNIYNIIGKEYYTNKQGILDTIKWLEKNK